jgi:putative DNA primase/helicase
MSLKDYNNEEPDEINRPQEDLPESNDKQSFEEAIFKKYDIDPNPLTFEQINGIVSHDKVLSAILSECNNLDFESLAKLQEGQNVTRKQFQIIVVEKILEIAKERKLSLCKKNGSIYAFNAAYWQQVEKEIMEYFLGLAAEKLGVDEFVSKHYTFKQELFKQFLSSAFLNEADEKVDGVKVNLQNGTFVITPDAQYLRPFDSKDFLTHRLPFSYDENADCPLFSKYLDRVLPDKEQQKVITEYLGYIFIEPKVLKLEKALILVGSGANGKSVFFDVVNALLGEENVSNYSLAALTNREGYQRAKLSDILVNYASEISPNMDSTIFKQLVSGEPVEARLPHREPFLLKDYAKFIFNTNNLPRDVEQNEAFYRRFLIGSFNVLIPEQDRDPKLAQKIIASDLPGIFNLVLEGLNRVLINQGFSKSSAMANAVKEYRQQSDTAFIYLEDKGYTAGEDEKMDLYNFYSDYNEYCKNSGYRPCSKKTLSERLKHLGYNMVRMSSGMYVKYSKIKV